MIKISEETGGFEESDDNINKTWRIKSNTTFRKRRCEFICG